MQSTRRIQKKKEGRVENSAMLTVKPGQQYIFAEMDILPNANAVNNSTEQVEREVTSAFKTFASQQRRTIAANKKVVNKKEARVENKPNQQHTSVEMGTSTKAPVNNPTVLVERDGVRAFKTFASQQRRTIEHERVKRKAADKEVKLADLKKFAETFKLTTPIPEDLLPHLAKDKEKQQRILAQNRLDAVAKYLAAKTQSEDVYIKNSAPEGESKTIQFGFTAEESDHPKQVENIEGEHHWSPHAPPVFGSMPAPATQQRPKASQLKPELLPAVNIWQARARAQAAQSKHDIQSHLDSTRHENKPETVAQSVYAPESSMGTLNYTQGSSGSLNPQSTKPSSISMNTTSRRGLKSIKVQTRIVEELEPEAEPENLVEHVEGEPCWDGHSTISTDSVSVLNPQQKHDIIKKFTEAVLKSIDLLPHESDSFGISFRERFEPFLKDYSEQVKNDTLRKSQRQAAKQIRKLRRDISGKCEEALRGRKETTKDHRVYPNIIKEVEKVNLPEKTWDEKVKDWARDQGQHLEEPSPGDSHVNLSSGIAEEPEPWAQRHALSEGFSDGHSVSNPPSLSGFDDNTTTSNGNNAEIIHFGAAEDLEIFNYLTTHHAFHHLVSEAQRLIERYYTNPMDLIRHRVSLGLRRPLNRDQGLSSLCRATFHMDWDIVDFLRGRYPCGIAQDLGCILTITGQAQNAHLSTVQSYSDLTWPENSQILLEALQFAITEYAQGGTATLPPTTISQDGGTRVFMSFDTQTLTVDGREDSIVSVAQQLAWLVATCRASPTSELAYSHASLCEDLEEDSPPDNHVPTFRISSEVLQLDSDEPRSCWNELVGSTVIAAGFPIPKRLHGEIGLEILLNIMAALGGIPFATQYDGGYLLKGRSVMFIPVERRANSVQWHLVEKRGDRIRYKDVAKLCPNRLPVQKLNEKELLTTRAFLGWCDRSVNNLASTSTEYHRIGFSKANRPSRNSVSITGGSVGFSYFATGSATVAIGKHNGPYSAERSTYYSDILDDAKQIHVILQDMQERCAWQTDAERIILHIILHRHLTGAHQLGREIVQLQTADPGKPESLRQAMLENADCIIAYDQSMKDSTIKTKVFKDAVGEIYALLEGLEGNSEKISMAGIELKSDWRKRIHGYEYMELVQNKHKIQLKETELRKSCGNWPEYSRDINAVVLFGTNFGEVFQPVSTTKLCLPLRAAPKQKDYLVIEVPTLSLLYAENGSLHDQDQITATGTQWHRSKHLFQPCPRVKSRGGSHHCKCERIQEFVPKGAFGNVSSPGVLGESGLVIFGHSTSSWINGFTKPLSDVLGTVRQHDNLPKDKPSTSLAVLREGVENSDGDSAELKSKEEKSFLLMAPHRIDNKAQGIANTSIQIENMNAKARFPGSHMKRLHSSSFYSNESSSLSTRKGSSTATTNSDYSTPTTSEYTESNRGHSYFSNSSHRETQMKTVRSSTLTQTKPSLRNGIKQVATQSNNSLPPSPLLYSDILKSQPIGLARPGRKSDNSKLTVASTEVASSTPLKFDPKVDQATRVRKDETHQGMRTIHGTIDLRTRNPLQPKNGPQSDSCRSLRRKPNFESHVTNHVRACDK